MTTDTDRELLVLSAKAAELVIRWAKWDSRVGPFINNSGWNPLHDDRDAFQLAVKLLIDIEFDDDGGGVEVWGGGGGIEALPANGDLLAATRRAIVLSAAEIGRAMP